MGTQGVLLYYKYIRLDHDGAKERVHGFYSDLCRRLEQKGRVRVAADGVNVTVGGSMDSLQLHIEEVKAHELLQGSDIDFKLAVSQGPRSEGARRDSGWDTLAVHMCKELVSLGPNVQHRADPFTHSAPHLTPQEFHDMLLQGVAPDGRPMVLLDARNIYETAIGFFDAPGVPRLDPSTRRFGELPAWLDTHATQLRNKRVMMYCTGGVRCERASALLKELGEGFEDVYQLSGGIQRYLEAYPDGGGLYRGGLFVYDERCSVSPEGGAAGVVGRCVGCQAPYDDYGSRSRCSSCRMLVLLCPNCQHLTHEGPGVQCVLCLKRKARVAGEPAGQPEVEEAEGGETGRKLRILCLHGFRQTAKQFKTSMHALEAKLSDLAQLVYVDAPHLLPLYFKPRPEAGAHEEAPAASPPVFNETLHPSIGTRRSLDQQDSEGSMAEPPSPRRRAWLVAPSFGTGTGSSEGSASPVVGSPASPSGWRVAPPECDARQYTRQIFGWAETQQVLEEAIAEQGPFDGVLGVSQGAAVAAVLCALQQERQRREQGQQEQQQGQAQQEEDEEAEGGSGQAGQMEGVQQQAEEQQQPRQAQLTGEPQTINKGSVPPFRFAVLADGFMSPCPQHQALFARQAPLQLPSLHTWNTTGASRRIISAEESEKLARQFERPRLLHHRGGHMLPADSQQVQELRAFLAAQRSTCDAEPLAAHAT